jgi:AmmeMemoRadiSam system protein A
MDRAEGAQLAAIAVGAVRARLLDQSLVVLDVFVEPGASFVTLERKGALRGCVGTLEAIRPLCQDVQRNAVKAMRDPRLPAVTADDWPELDVKVSVLGTPAALPARTRQELLAALRPGRDGLILADARRRATFLPAVWAKLPVPGDFVDALLAKGGWPEGAWPADLLARRYTSEEFRNDAPRESLHG